MAQNQNYLILELVPSFLIYFFHLQKYISKSTRIPMSLLSTFHFCHTQLLNFKGFLSQIVSAQTQINDLKHYLNSHANEKELAYLFAYIQGLSQQSIFTQESQPKSAGETIQDVQCHNMKGVIDLNDILEKSLFQEHSKLIRSTPEVKNILCHYFQLQHPNSSINFDQFLSLLKPRYPKTSNQKYEFENSIIGFTQIIDAIVNNFFTIEAKRQELSSVQIKQLFMHKYGDKNDFKIDSLKSFMHDTGIYNKDAFSKSAHYIFGEQKIIPWENILITEPDQKQEKQLFNDKTALVVRPSNVFEQVDQLESKLKNAIKRRQSKDQNQKERMEKKYSQKVNSCIDQKLRDVESCHIIKYGIPGITIVDEKVETLVDKQNRQEAERMRHSSTTQKIGEIQRRAMEMQGQRQTNKNADFNQFWKLRFKQHYFPEPSKIFLRTNYRISY